MRASQKVGNNPNKLGGLSPHMKTHEPRTVLCSFQLDAGLGGQNCLCLGHIKIKSNPIQAARGGRKTDRPADCRTTYRPVLQCTAQVGHRHPVVTISHRKSRMPQLVFSLGGHFNMADNTRAIEFSRAGESSPSVLELFPMFWHASVWPQCGYTFCVCYIHTCVCNCQRTLCSILRCSPHLTVLGLGSLTDPEAHPSG